MNDWVHHGFIMDSGWHYVKFLSVTKGESLLALADFSTTDSIIDDFSHIPLTLHTSDSPSSLSQDSKWNMHHIRPNKE